MVDAPVAVGLGVMGSATSLAGALAAQHPENAAQINRCTKPALGVFLLHLAPTMYFQRRQNPSTSFVDEITNTRNKLGLVEFYKL